MSPLRVWEETWLYVPSAGDIAPVVETHGGQYMTPNTADPQQDARARLAAEAPAMARTLMLLAGMGTDPYCNGCGDTSKNGHKRDCSLMQLLFDAGLGDISQSDRSAVLRLVK